MAIEIHVARPLTANPELCLQPSEEVAAALALLRTEGALLRVWRGSTPHNWWIENDFGDEMHFTVEADNRHIPQLLLAVVTPVAVDGGAQRIAPSLLHRDGGQRYAEGWRYDRAKHLLLEQRWASEQASRRSLQLRVEAFAPKLEALSERALALLRTLRRGDLGFYTELVPEYLALAQQGLVSFTSTAGVRCIREVRTLRIPRGELLKIIHA